MPKKNSIVKEDKTMEQATLSPQFRTRIKMLVESLVCVSAGLAILILLPAYWSPNVRGFLGVLTGTLTFLAIFSWQFPNYFRNVVTESSSRDSLGKVFHVPNRFGIRSIVFLTLVFALLTNLLRAYSVQPFVFIFCLSFVGAITAFQIFYSRVPRLASTIAGSIVVCRHLLESCSRELRNCKLELVDCWRCNRRILCGSDACGSLYDCWRRRTLVASRELLKVESGCDGTRNMSR